MKTTKLKILAVPVLFVVIFIAIEWTAIASWRPLQRSIQPPGAQQMHTALDSLAANRGDWATFSVTYDDLHPFHGGLTLTIHGDGSVEQRALREETRESRQVSRQDLARLVALLREMQVWEQRTPERTAVPDESRSRVTIRSGKAEVTIWEWYNDMRSNNRIIRVRDLMTEIAWAPKPGR